MAIHGAVNPLAPMACVELQATADGVELPGLTPDAAADAGDLIVKGTLMRDGHDLLEQGQLTADHHLVMDQLTFGAQVDRRDATTLPVRLAVTQLQKARGAIAVDVPVAGSRSDPACSLGGVSVDACVHLIVKTVTSPFRLIAAAGRDDAAPAHPHGDDRPGPAGPGRRAGACGAPMAERAGGSGPALRGRADAQA
jgi:hypothetical protein